MKKAGFVLATVLAATCLAAQAASDAVLDGIIPQTPEGKIVKDLFGKKIVDAKATSGDEDDLEVARQLMTAQGDSSTAPKLKTALSLTALRLSMASGTGPAAELARQALEALDKTAPMGTLEKYRYLKEIASHRLTKARSEHKTGDEMAKIATQALEAAIAFIREAMNDEGSTAELVALLPVARSWVAVYGLQEYSSSLSDLEKSYKAGIALRARLKDALDKLGALNRAKDTDGAKAAAKTVADLYLEGWGNLKSAAKYYEGIDEPRALTVRRAAAMLEEPTKMDMATAPATLEQLIKLSDSLKGPAKTSVNLSSLQLAKAYLNNDPPEASVGRVKLMIVQLEAATGESPTEKLRKELTAAYGKFQGKLEIIGADRIRLTYDFSSHSQIKDWETSSGQWDVQGGVLACRTNSYGTGQINCRFPFRQDKPFKVSYTCGGKYEAGCQLNIRAWGAQWNLAEAAFTIGRYGLYYNAGDSYSNDRRVQLNADKTYPVTVSSQGDGNITWTLGGLTYQNKLRSGVKGSFQLQFATRDADKTLTAFRNVVIEGTILPKADWAPEGAPRNVPPPPRPHPEGN